MSNTRCKHGRWIETGCEDCGIAPLSEIETEKETEGEIYISDIEKLIKALHHERSYLPNDNSRRLYSLAITDLESAVNWLRRLE